MTSRRRGGLGSGLDALLPAAHESSAGSSRNLRIDDIRANMHQPRIHFDQAAIDELAASIREHGIIQPLIVSEDNGGRYTLIAGERRWRAARQAGLNEVPVIVREAAAQQVLELALIENVQRADLNALEEARAYQALVDDFGMSDGEIARRLGKGSRESIANTRRLLNLVPEAQDAVLQGRISAGHGRALLKIKQQEQQQQALQAITQHEYNVRQAERLADLIDIHQGDLGMAIAELEGKRSVAAQTPRKQAPVQTESSVNQLSADDLAIQRSLEEVLGTPVSFQRSERQVRVTISFHTEEKLQEFFDWIQQR